MKKNHNIKKNIALLTALVITAMTAAGCSNNDSSAMGAAPSYDTPATTTGTERSDDMPSTTTRAPSNDSGDYTTTRPQKNANASNAVAEGEVPANDSMATYEPYDGWDTQGSEEYNSYTESGFKSVQSEPLSTFSADVDTASYSNVRRMLTDYGYVDPDAVRIEEMLNYFDYEYVKPKNDLFSINVELSDCPWNNGSKLMLVGMQAKEIKNTDNIDSNIVFLIDVSGSMFDYDKLPLVIESFSMLTDNLTENDRISIVTYAGSDEIVLTGADGSEKKKIKRALESLEAGGSTAGAAGINTAYELAEEYFIEGGNNRVILATDGDLNVGISSEEGLTELIEEKRESGVFLSVLGFGTGNIKDNKMEALADHGNGNYSYIDSLSEAKKVLVDELDSTLYAVAKDVKFQVEFNPEFVSEYRLVGYDNRIMAAEDFSDDTKDAGEIGSGHSVTALYEIVPVGSEVELKYQPEKNVRSEDGEWLTVSVRCKQPDEDKSELYEFPVNSEIYTEKMPENLRFAAAVAEFGMLLKDSAYSGTASYRSLEALLDDCAITDEYKAEFVELVELAADR